MISSGGYINTGPLRVYEGLSDLFIGALGRTHRYTGVMRLPTTYPRYPVGGMAAGGKKGGYLI
jgi:hypothetical protein